ncbi:MAG TPA: hypothetical protein VFZ78_09630, partial [Flavisolibacter sp.]
MKNVFFFFLFSCSLACAAQDTYADSMRTYIENYVSNHGVVRGADKQHLHFFDINSSYRLQARFEKLESSPWFEMPSTGVQKKMYRR